MSANPATFLIGPEGVVIERDLRSEALLEAVRKLARESSRGE